MTEYIITNFVTNDTLVAFEGELIEETDHSWTVKLHTALPGMVSETIPGEVIHLNKKTAIFMGHEVIDERRIQLLLLAIKKYGLKKSAIYERKSTGSIPVDSN